MRDLTIESLPANERETAEDYVQRFSEHLMSGSPGMNDLVAREAARDLISEAWIRMGPQAPPFDVNGDAAVLTKEV